MYRVTSFNRRLHLQCEEPLWSSTHPSGAARLSACPGPRPPSEDQGSKYQLSNEIKGIFICIMLIKDHFTFNKRSHLVCRAPRLLGVCVPERPGGRGVHVHMPRVLVSMGTWPSAFRRVSYSFPWTDQNLTRLVLSVIRMKNLNRNQLVPK